MNGFNLNIGPDDFEQKKCENCGFPYFQQAFALGKINALKSPTGKSEIVQEPVMLCLKCGWPFGAPLEHSEETTLNNESENVKEENETNLISLTDYKKK